MCIFVRASLITIKTIVLPDTFDRKRACIIRGDREEQRLANRSMAYSDGVVDGVSAGNEDKGLSADEIMETVTVREEAGTDGDALLVADGDSDLVYLKEEATGRAMSFVKGVVSSYIDGEKKGLSFFEDEKVLQRL